MRLLQSQASKSVSVESHGLPSSFFHLSEMSSAHFVLTPSDSQALSSQPLSEVDTAINLIIRTETQRSDVTCLMSHNKSEVELEFNLWTV